MTKYMSVLSFIYRSISNGIAAGLLTSSHKVFID